MASRVEPKTVMYNGRPHDCYETEITLDYSIAKIWKKSKLAGAICGAVTAAVVVPCGAVKYGFDYVAKDKDTRDKTYDTCKSIFTGKKTKKEYVEQEITPALSKKTWGVDCTNRAELTKFVEEKKAAGLYHNAEGTPHQYIILPNSAIILIPDGDNSKAHLQTLFDAETHEGFSGDDLNKAIRVFFEWRDPLMRNGGKTYGVWLIDIKRKTVKALDRLPDPNKPYIEATGTELRLKESDKLFEKSEAIYNPDARDLGKIKIHDEKGPKVKPTKKKEESEESDEVVDSSMRPTLDLTSPSLKHGNPVFKRPNPPSSSSGSGATPAPTPPPAPPAPSAASASSSSSSSASTSSTSSSVSAGTAPSLAAPTPPPAASTVSATSSVSASTTSGSDDELDVTALAARQKKEREAKMKKDIEDLLAGNPLFAPPRP